MTGVSAEVLEGRSTETYVFAGGPSVGIGYLITLSIERGNMNDPEIQAMTAVATALNDLNEDIRGRVLRWAAERFEVDLPAGGRAAGGGGGGDASDGDGSAGNGSRTDITETEIANEAPIYEHFAELFAKAEPKTDADKALVAAYWVQVHEGNGSWQSQALNTRLKNLGHAVGHITDAMTNNIQKKPQRIIQLQKSGNTRQGRKTYKVTHEGMVYVQGMLGGGAS